jgi:hypothetical protein
MCLPYQPHRKVASTSTLFLVGLVIIVHKFEQHSHFGFYEFIAHLLPRWTWVQVVRTKYRTCCEGLE